ncbi:DUF2567 domain-containing protein [Amycolatopsis sp. CA-230715]|uniref:DUF2567 domain-containing protein n=1 Tax=Amycolatopsis sp. CA-230715 TaxID=2745196 RepID=UPI001C338C34|nr:hypothetical protein HUW46_01542 [Amycolatopsis sp. CA-230715]
MADTTGTPMEASGSVYGELPPPPWFALPQERPKVVVKADLLPAVTVLSTVGLLGIPLGWLWSRLAPPERFRIVSLTEKPVPLQLESWHHFDDLAIFALLGLGIGLFTGALLWLLRERRGPVVLVAGLLGGLVAGWLASLLGPGLFAGWVYPAPSPPRLGDVVTQAPVLDTLWVLLAMPLGTALVYGLLAAWNGREDLGRRLG